MIRIKILAGLAALTSAIAISATPALAEFESNSSATTGKTTITTNGVFEVGGAKVECAASGISATWKIQAAGGLGKQSPTKRGPHQSLAIKWQTSENNGQCMTEVVGQKIKLNVLPCNLQLEQVGASTTEVRGSVETECLIKFPGCEIKVPQGTGTKNIGLTKVLVENSGSNLNLKETRVGGITAILTGALCPETGEKGKAKLSGFTGVTLGEKLV